MKEIRGINPIDKSDTVVIYHNPCIDGMTAAYIAHTALALDNRVAHFAGGTYGKPVPVDVTGRDVFILDFSYKPNELEQMAKAAKSVTILDHHQTAEADLKPLLEAKVIGGRFDMKRSGATLAWEHFFAGEETPEGVRYVEDRDLWNLKMPQSGDINRVLGSYLIEPTESAFREWGAALGNVPTLRAEAKPVGRFLSSMVRLYMQGQHTITAEFNGETIQVPAVNCPYFISSEVGDQLLRQNPQAPMSICWCVGRIDGDDPSSDQCVQFSLRSRKGDKIDTTPLARKFGGGGHASASGFKLRGDSIRQFMTSMTLT